MCWVWLWVEKLAEVEDDRCDKRMMGVELLRFG